MEIREQRWMANYNALKEYIKERGHLPGKNVVENRELLNWAKYQRRKINNGTLDENKVNLFKALMATRTQEHTGGRKKKIDITSPLDSCQSN